MAFTLNSSTNPSRRRSLLALVACCAGVASGPGYATTRLDSLREWRLPNGLSVVALPDATASRVALQVWYGVGSRYDPTGRSGFAHLFEHMMFKSTRHLANEEFSRLAVAAGGETNAFTEADVTVFHSTLRPEHLSRFLWAEADRMQFLALTQSEFDTERLVVIEELQTRRAEPYGELTPSAMQSLFATHAYGRAVAGSVTDLQAATLAEAQAFYHQHYGPNNATLVVTGQFDVRLLEAQVEKYFGAAAGPQAGSSAQAFAPTGEPAAAPLVVQDAAIPAAAAALSWAGKGGADPSMTNLRLAQAMLGKGPSAWLTRNLVHRLHVAQSAECDLVVNKDASALIVSAKAAAGVPFARLEAAVGQSVKEFLRSNFIERELAGARNALLVERLQEQQDPAGLALALGRSASFQGTAKPALALQASLAASTPSSVRRDLNQLLQATPARVRYSKLQGTA